VSAVMATLPPRATASGRLEAVPEAASRALIARLEATAAARDALGARVAGSPVAAVDTTDGLRMTLESGEILHLRPSGNAPELRCYAEAEVEARATALTEATLAAVRALLAEAP